MPLLAQLLDRIRQFAHPEECLFFRISEVGPFRFRGQATSEDVKFS